MLQTTQDLVDQISSMIEDYLENKENYTAPVMTIGHENGFVAVHLNEPKRVIRPQDCVEYDVKDLYITDELKSERPFFAAINQIANSWIKEE